MTPAQLLDEAQARLDVILWLPGCNLASGADVPEGFCDLVDDLPAEPDAPLCKALPALQAIVLNEGPKFIEEIAAALADTDGFVIRVAVPMRHFNSDGAGFRYSWGGCYTRWFYARSPDKFAEIAKSFSDEMYDMDLKKVQPERVLAAA